MIDDIKVIKKVFILSFPLLFFLILFLCLLTNESGSGDSAVLATNYFTIPFESKTLFTITSEFGYRIDPLETNKEKFHSGMDLAAPKGTPVLASANGIVVGTGYSESLGNYVYLKHTFDNLVYYSAYGHMLDDSIVVTLNQKVECGEKIGEVGSTGASTGYHLHFTIMSPILSFEKKYLVDPNFVIKGLK